jgi:phosphoesterase RecJ-like protein
MALTEQKLDLDTQQADFAWEALNKAQKIGIISHRHPDPDSIGSNLALRAVLTNLGKTVDSLCVHNPPQTCQAIAGSANFQNTFEPNDYDVLISVDCGSLSQVAFEKMSGNYFQGTFINIDHHTSNNNFGKINLVYTKLSSTCEIIYQLLRYWQQPLNKQIATCLLFGLYYDTGSFMHSNVTPQVLEMASDLIGNGASIQTVIENLYHNFNLKKYHLWGNALQKIKITENQAAVSVVTTEDLNNFQASQEDLGGLINYVSMAKESQFALMINQDNTQQIKGSLRTSQDKINLSELAGQFGGGGHRKASGFSFPGKIEKHTIWKINN